MALVFCDRLVTLSPWLEQESIYPRLGMVIAIYLCSAPMAWGLTSAEIKRFPNDMIEAYLGISTFGTIAFGVLLFIRSCIQSFEKETPTE
jgi:ABC-type Fe3+ transport system permease subunit